MKHEKIRRFRLAFDSELVDLPALWTVAADCAASRFGMTPDDVVDTIGPREDPDVEACAAMLIDAVAGKSGIFDAIRIVVSDAAADPRYRGLSWRDAAARQRSVLRLATT